MCAGTLRDMHFRTYFSLFPCKWQKVDNPLILKKKLCINSIQIHIGLVSQIFAFQDQICSQSLQFQIFRLPWQHFPILMNLGELSFRGLHILKISTFYTKRSCRKMLRTHSHDGHVGLLIENIPPSMSGMYLGYS